MFIRESLRNHFRPRKLSKVFLHRKLPTIIVGRFRLGRLKESIYMNREIKIPHQAKHLGSAILDPYFAWRGIAGIDSSFRNIHRCTCHAFPHYSVSYSVSDFWALCRLICLFKCSQTKRLNMHEDCDWLCIHRLLEAYGWRCFGMPSAPNHWKGGCSRRLHENDNCWPVSFGKAEGIHIKHESKGQDSSPS